MTETAHPTHHSATTDRATRALAVATVTGLTGLGVYVSYRHMLTLAHRHGVHGLDAHAFPLFVDGLDLISILVLLADRRAHRRSGLLPWIVLACGALTSFAANVAVAPDNLVARGISGISAIALLAAAKMLAHLFDTSTILTTGIEPVRFADVRHSEDPEQADTADLSRRVFGDPARRVPTSPDAYARWRQIWQSTRHLPAATEDAARTHDVSLRTLQLIRAAGQQGHLDAPAGPAGNGHAPAAQPAGRGHDEPVASHDTDQLSTATAAASS